ncbi:MAG TPA: hypothetical protein VK327_00005 [Candidatus Paceibacterota bacterium]|nr:hypothetical protein [Candidatus Paceibacterota bacterium]
MNAVLICPSICPAVAQLAIHTPLAAIPFLGESLLEYWLTHLAMAGATNVRVLASDRPEHIAALIDNGARWGLKAEVVPEPRELTPVQAQIKYAGELVSSPFEVTLLDRFPGSSRPLFTCYVRLFAGILEWLPHALTPDRVGIRQLSPGVFVGLHSRIAQDAKILAPCWIGRNVFIGTGATIGPMTVIEDRSFIERDAEVFGSVVGPDTFVGKAAVIREAIAWGNTLIHWKSDAFTEVTDAFLLSSLRRPALASQSAGFVRRLGDIYSRNKEDLQTFWKHFLLNKDDKLSTHDKL